MAEVGVAIMNSHLTFRLATFGDDRLWPWAVISQHTVIDFTMINISETAKDTGQTAET